jgi:hypothetical protein
MRAHIYACWLVRREDTRVRRHPRGLVFGGWRHPPPAHNPRCLSYCTAQPSHHTAASAPSSSASTSSNPHTQVEAPGVAAAILSYILCTQGRFSCPCRLLQRVCFPLQQGERDALLSAAARRACWRRSALPGPGWLWPCAAASACPPRCVGCPPAVWPGALPPPRPPFCCPAAPRAAA